MPPIPQPSQPEHPSFLHSESTSCLEVLFLLQFQTARLFPKYVNQSKQFLNSKGMEGHYSVRDIVWAKVEPHPWWPGKIVKIIQQNEKTVYKVSFFADPTYTFLHSHQLTPYLELDSSAYAQDLQLPQLEKAVRMAKAYFTRLTGKPQEDVCDMQVTPLTDFCLDEKREENLTQNIILPVEENPAQGSQAMQIESSQHDGSTCDEITVDNVLEMIERNRKKQKNVGYSYENRKGEMQLQAELKRNLLLKYNLFDFANEKPTRPAQTASKRSIIQITPQRTATKQLKKICKEKTKNKHLLQSQTDMLSSKCLRKLTALLRNAQESTETCKIHAIKIMKRIVALAEGNRVKLQSLFCTAMKAVSLGSASMRCEERLAEFGNYLEGLENDKKEDESSKITQIQSIN